MTNDEGIRKPECRTDLAPSEGFWLGGVTRHENIRKRARFCDLAPVFSEFGSLDLFQHLTFVLRPS